MPRFLIAALLLLMPTLAHAQMREQELVDRATLAAQDMLNDRDGTQAQGVFRRARAALICPRVFRAGFVFGGQGGDCVLVARDAAGSWSYPAFYDMSGGSFGLQAGIQDAEVMMMILTEKGLRAIIDDQFEIGGNAQAAFASFGGGVQGSTTTAAGADIVAFARTRGLFAGVTLDGNTINARSQMNQEFYGQPLSTAQIILQMQGRNPAADPLRAVLTRYGAGGPASAPTAGARPLPDAPAAMPQPLEPVQQQSLAPPPR